MNKSVLLHLNETISSTQYTPWRKTIKRAIEEAWGFVEESVEHPRYEVYIRQAPIISKDSYLHVASAEPIFKGPTREVWWITFDDTFDWFPLEVSPNLFGKFKRELSFQLGKLDLYTVAMHELGHVFGLADSDLATDIMYRYAASHKVYNSPSLSEYHAAHAKLCKNEPQKL